jgi:hypothetical protein
MNRMAVSAALLTVMAGLPAQAADEPDEEERREADCIDQYNSKTFANPDEAGFRRNPFLVRMLAGGKLVGSHEGDAALPRDHELGGQLDLELPVLLSSLLRSSGATDFGLGAGFSGSYWEARGQSREFGGEVRIGLLRRRYQPTWSNPGAIQPRCRRTRTDLGVDLLRWRIGGFTDLVAAGSPTVLTSSIGFPNLTRRYSYSTWGIAWSVSALEFRVAPTFQLGTRGYAEYDVGRVAFRGEMHVRWRLGWPSVFFTLLAGLNFELGNGLL